MNNKVNLTEKQQTFLDYLFGQAEGDVRTAAELAGYANPEANAWRVAKTLTQQIIERTREYLATQAPKAAFSVGEIISGSDWAPGARDRLAAAKDVLDRAGVTKSERFEIDQQPSGLFILPPKAVD